MELLVLLLKNSGVLGAQTVPPSELLKIESDVITLEVAKQLTSQLVTGIGRIVVTGPVVSDSGKTATIEVQSDASLEDLRARAVPILHILMEGLRQAGVEVSVSKHG